VFLVLQIQLTGIDAELEAVRYAIHGGMWGDGCTLGEQFLNLRDPSDPTSPHPLLLSFTRYITVSPIPELDGRSLHGFGEWAPAKWRWMTWSTGTTGGRRDTTAPSDEEQKQLRQSIEVGAV